MAAALLWIYALSGAAALLYQVVWQRWLVFTVGLSTVSIGIIVAGFLSGLGVGYLAGGRLADRLTPRQALGVFAALEMGIALCALLSEPVLYGWLPTVSGLGPEAPGRTYLVVLLLLLPPTCLMGASLPVLSRSVQLGTVLEQSGLISRLYFANTLGGAVAAVATAFVVVAEWGFDGAVRVGAAGNLLCAVGGLLLWRRVSATAAIPVQVAAPVATAAPTSMWWLGWLGHAFVAGLTGIAWEVIAFRLVENIVKSQAQTFAVILGVFLTGLAFGGLMGDTVRTRLGTRRRGVFLASQTTLYLWLAGSIVGLITLLESWRPARRWMAFIAAYDPSISPTLALVNYVLLPGLVLFVPALVMGFGFSVSQQLLQTSAATVGRRLGLVQFVNILGCVAGATLTTQVAIPWVGTSGALKLVAMLGLGYAGVWWWTSSRRTLPSVAAVLLAGLVVAVPSQDHLWRVLAGQRDPGRLFYREDASGVSSIRLVPGRWPASEVFANGLGQSMLPRPLDTHHVLLGAIPTMVHPRPVSVGIIGVGSGGTLWGASASPVTERVVAWEIMASQAALLAEYATRTDSPAISWFLRDPRIAIRHADGRHALRRGVERYDVIEADALRPSSAYAGNLYSIEFFELVRARLTEGGLAATWVPTPRVLETMRRVFPHVVHLGNLVALGSEAPLTVDWPTIAQRLDHPDVTAHFRAGQIDIRPLMEPVFTGGGAALPPLGPFDATLVNTDMRPRDELPRLSALLSGRR